MNTEYNIYDEILLYIYIYTHTSYKLVQSLKKGIVDFHWAFAFHTDAYIVMCVSYSIFRYPA